MARLATFNLMGQNGNVLTAPVAMLINSARVKSVSTVTNLAGVLAALVYSRMNDRDLDTLLSSDSEATIRTELNTDNVTNTTTTIPLTMIPTDLNSESGVKDFAVNQIVQVQPWPDDATDSLVFIRVNDWTVVSYRMGETMAAIKALANA